ncbi:MAG: pseudouridine synthase [Gammaproteobacteria bacterium]|nr:pseudouridine synthase [Gammaproteobacteria bacterium]MDX2486226.1 pseudouridine synthase [Gammaproteobacteria bacterium]
MSDIYLFNKPYGVLTQFTDRDERPVLADFIDVPAIYPAGRLDKDSEGLLLLTSDGKLQQAVSDPAFKLAKTYFVQVEGILDDEALERLRTGLQLKDGITRPARVSKLATEPEGLWQRKPPVRYRASIPDSWIELTIREGRNRQVRRMTAAVGHPTLRLIRYAIGDFRLDGLQPGEITQLPAEEVEKFISALPRRGRKKSRRR